MTNEIGYLSFFKIGKWGGSFVNGLGHVSFWFGYVDFLLGYMSFSTGVGGYASLWFEKTNFFDRGMSVFILGAAQVCTGLRDVTHAYNVMRWRCRRPSSRRLYTARAESKTQHLRMVIVEFRNLILIMWVYTTTKIFGTSYSVTSDSCAYEKFRNSAQCKR